MEMGTEKRRESMDRRSADACADSPSRTPLAQRGRSTRSLCAAITASIDLYAAGDCVHHNRVLAHSTCAVALAWSSHAESACAPPGYGSYSGGTVAAAVEAVLLPRPRTMKLLAPMLRGMMPSSPLRALTAPFRVTKTSLPKCARG